MNKIALVVPCYNEEENIPIFLETMKKNLSMIKEKGYDDDFLFIFINDGSKDNTLGVIKNYCYTIVYPYTIKYISFSKNCWKEAALLAGLKKAKTENVDACIMMDVDLQDPPELIEKMLDYWYQGYKHIYTKHKNRKGESFLKKFFALSFYKVYSFFTKDKSIAKGARDFSLLDKSVIDAFLEMPEQERFTKGIASYVGFKKYCIEFEYAERKKGKSKMNFKRLFSYAMTGINFFSKILYLIPKIVLAFYFVMLTIDCTYMFVSNTPAREIFNSSSLRIDVAMIFLAFMFSGITKLGYDIKEHTIKKPIYFIDEEN